MSPSREKTFSMPLPEAHRRLLVRVAMGSLVASFLSYAAIEALTFAATAQTVRSGAFPPSGPDLPDTLLRALGLGDFLAPAALVLLLVLVATRSLSEEERGGVEVALLLLLAGLLAPFVLPDAGPLSAWGLVTPMLVAGALLSLAWSLPRARPLAIAGALAFVLRMASVLAMEALYVRASGDVAWIPAALYARLAPSALGLVAALLLASAFLPGTLQGRLAPPGPAAAERA